MWEGQGSRCCALEAWAGEHAYLILVLIWLALTIPSIFIRGAHYEEGTTIGLARGAFEDGWWLSPHIYGLRLVERPVLVSWLLGALGTATGVLPVWAGRLPAVLSILASASLVYRLVSRVSGRWPALFGAVCFLVSPMMLQKLTTAENDSVVTALLFIAFVLWWTGSAGGGPRVGRWVVVSLVLTLAGLVKGPQPLGYFYLGVGLYLVTERSWRQLVALCASGILPAAVLSAWYLAVYQPGDLQLWAEHSRVTPVALLEYLEGALHFTAQLALELLPAVVLAAMLVVDVWRRRAGTDRHLVKALACYAAACTLVLIVWPHAQTRYAMPALPAVAALAGIALQAYAARLPRLIAGAEVAAGLLLVFGLAANLIVAPLLPGQGQTSIREAANIAEQMATAPGPLYAAGEAVDRNALLYLNDPHMVTAGDLRDVATPFWAIVGVDQVPHLVRMLPKLRVVPRLDLPDARLVEVSHG